MGEEGRRAIGKKKANGEGSVARYKDGRWCATHTFHAPDGRPARRAFYGRTKAEALAKREKAIADYHNGLMVFDTENLTTAEYLDRWLDDSKRDAVRQRTLENYAYVVRVHLKPTLGNTKLKALTPARVQSLYRSKLDSGLSARTVRLIHTVLHGALKQAVRWELVARNVTEAVAAPKPDKSRKKEIRPLDQNQADALLEEVRGDRLGALYRLAVTAGLRQGELLGLRWQDVDLGRGTLCVRQQLTRTKKHGLTFTEPKTKKSRRSVKLTQGTVEALRAHRKRQLKEKLMMGHLWQDTGLVFTTTAGTPLDVGNLTNHSFRPLLERAGLPKIRFHDLRHTCATLLLRRNVNPKIVQELLGHASISETMDTYSHVLPDMQGEAVAAMEVAFS